MSDLQEQKVPTNEKKTSQVQEQEFAPRSWDVVDLDSPDQQTDLVLGDETDSFIEITSTDMTALLFGNDTDSALNPYQPMTLTEQTRNVLQPLAQCVMASVPAAERALNRAYTIKYSPEITEQIKQRMAKAMEPKVKDGSILSSVVNRDSNKIIGQGRLFRVSNLAAIGTASWQILSIATAQHYLQDIQQQLVRIESSISEIRSWLEASNYAKLINNFRTLNRIREILLNNQKLNEADIDNFAKQISGIDHESGDILEHFRLMMEQTTRKIKQLPPRDINAAHQVLTDYERFANAYLIAVSIRATAAQVWCALPLNYEVARKISLEIENDIHAWEQSRSKFFADIRNRKRNIQQPWNDVLGNTKKQATKLGKAITASRSRLLDRLSPNKELVTVTRKRIENQIEAESRPLLLSVQVDESGAITQVARLKTELEMMLELTEYLRNIPGQEEISDHWFEHATVYRTLTHGITVRTCKLVRGHQIFIADNNGEMVYTRFIPENQEETLWKQLRKLPLLQSNVDSPQS